MGSKPFIQTRGIVVLLLFAALFLVFRRSDYYPSRLSDLVAAKTMPEAPRDVISKLGVSVRQVSSALTPPRLAVAVTNGNAQPVTILTWNSPLDPLALQLGLVSFTPEGAAGPVQIPTVQVRRKMPPERDALVTIAPGQTKEQVLELRAPVVPLDRLRGRVRVACRGEWVSVWLSEADAVPQASLEQAGASEDAFRGSFQSEAVEMEI